MKILKRIGRSVLVLLLVFAQYALVSGKTFLLKAVLYHFANID